MSALLNNVRNDQLFCTIILDELKALDGASPPLSLPSRLLQTCNNQYRKNLNSGPIDLVYNNQM